MMSPATYELQDVRQRVSDSFSLVIDSLTIHTGETLCLVGPTGAGKSTLLRLLSGLVAPTSGNMTFQGRPLKPRRSPPHCHRSSNSAAVLRHGTHQH
jgi:ABC-type Fe3+/spermidine/putrescine transport system ATPase subunit